MKGGSSEHNVTSERKRLLYIPSLWSGSEKRALAMQVVSGKTSGNIVTPSPRNAPTILLVGATDQTCSSEAKRHCRSSAPDGNAGERTRALRSDASARGIYDYHVTRDLPDVTMTHFQQSTSPSTCCSSACPSSSARTFSEPSNLGRASMYARAWAVCRQTRADGFSKPPPPR